MTGVKTGFSFMCVKNVETVPFDLPDINNNNK